MKPMRMKDDGRRAGLVEQIVPFGEGEFDYDDDSEEIYDEELDAELDRDLQEIVRKAKEKDRE